MSKSLSREQKQKIRRNIHQVKWDLDQILYGSEKKSTWCVYLLASQDCTKTYCGVTNNFIDRYRKHLQFIKGGAFSTKEKELKINQNYRGIQFVFCLMFKKKNKLYKLNIECIDQINLKISENGKTNYLECPILIH